MKKITAIVLSLITLIVMTAFTVSAESTPVTEKIVKDIKGISYLSSIEIEDTKVDSYYMTCGVVDIYDAYDLYVSQNQSWTKTIAQFRKAFTSKGYTEHERSDAYGDKVYIEMNGEEYFYIFGKQESKSASGEDGVVFIQYYSYSTKSPEKPSGWAETEVNEAIKEGLVPRELRKNYTKGISREDLSKMLSVLIDKVYDKEPANTDAKFTDTTDRAVLRAANLGIINGYKQADGSYAFKPNNTLKRSEMSAIINRVAKLCGKTTTGFDSEVKFADTVNHWCKSELGYPVHTGIVKGTSATAFSPENTLTVEQTIIMIYRTYQTLK